MATTPRDIKEIARAFIEMALAEGVADDVLRDLRAVSMAFRSDPRMLADLSETTTPFASRQNALKKALHKNVHMFVLNALFILQKRDLLHLLEPFVQSAMTFGQRLAKYAEVTVTSAVPLTSSELKDIKASLEKTYGGTTDIRETIDPNILGGLIIDIGDKRIDASIKGNITRLKQSLIA